MNIIARVFKSTVGKKFIMAVTGFFLLLFVLLLELKDKFETVGLGSSLGAVKSASHDILNALIALGYNEREAVASVKGLEADISVSEGIKKALKALSK